MLQMSTFVLAFHHPLQLSQEEHPLFEITHDRLKTIVTGRISRTCTQSLKKLENKLLFGAGVIPMSQTECTLRHFDSL